MEYEKLSEANVSVFSTVLTSLDNVFPSGELYHVIWPGLYRELRGCLMGPTGTTGEGMDRRMDSGKWILLSTNISN